MAYQGKVLHALTKKPLAGIPVSDGRNIALTDGNGQFSLEGWERAHIIHVDLLTRGQRDWFRTIPEFLQNPIFFVDPVETSSDFCFFHTSDTEIENRRDTEWVDRLREQVLRHKPSFFMHTGDLCRDEGVRRHHILMNENTIGCPVRYAIGNHDFVGEEYGEQRFEQDYGPTWYSFDCGSLHFAVLQIPYGDRPSGYMPQDQWLWLREDLKQNCRGKELVIFCHTICRDDELGFTVSIEDAPLSLREEGLRAWIFGHYHAHLCHDSEGILNISTARPDSGGIDSSPSGIRKYSIINGQHTTELLYSFTPSKADLSLWRTELPGQVEFSTPLPYGGDLLVATANDGFPKRCGIFRISGINGRILWSFLTPDGIRNDMALAADCLYAQDDFGTLYCLSAETGELFWSVRSPLRKIAHTGSGVLLTEDQVIVGKPCQLYAYHKETGALLWYAELPVSENTPARWLWDQERNQLLISAHWRGLIAIDPHNGSIRWQQCEQPVWFRSSTPLLVDGIIYTAGNRTLIKLSAENGEILLTRSVPFGVDVSGSPVRDGSTLYYPTATQGVIAATIDTLEPQRFFPTGINTLSTAPYVHGTMQTVEGAVQILGKHLIFTALDGYLYDYDKDTGKLLQKTAVGAPCLVSPLIVQDGIIVADFCGRVQKFPLPGEQK
ncbi:MAG: PQQ-binding-like beta-propeller repeat protein [Clostridia bacterium]|nr:PQQ-binding-like beta-propeller repeat protein [Clostridia bacterium]